MDIKALSGLVDFLIGKQDISYTLERHIQLMCYKIKFVAFATRKTIIIGINYDDSPIILTKKIVDALEEVVKQ